MTRLNVRSWGTGDRIAVLVHGMTTDSGSWWHTGPTLAERGYHVLAPDLPGHGHSPREGYTLAAMADAVHDSIPGPPELAIGHSLGGLVLATAIDRMRPARAVFEDPPWSTPPGPEVATFITGQRSWTREQLAAFHPRWASEAVEHKHRALALWDPTTTEMVAEYPGPRPVPPAVASLVLIGDNQPMIDQQLANQLRDEGYKVRTIPGAGHNIHNDDPNAFHTALDSWL